MGQVLPRKTGQARGQNARTKKVFVTLIFPPQLPQIATDSLSKNHARFSKLTKLRIPENKGSEERFLKAKLRTY